MVVFLRASCLGEDPEKFWFGVFADKHIVVRVSNKKRAHVPSLFA
jgi:hypothetical protein